MEMCDWFITAKLGDEQISLKKHVERLTEEAERRRRHRGELRGVDRCDMEQSTPRGLDKSMLSSGHSFLCFQH